MVTERDGWLMVPYDGPELAVIEIGFDGSWTPAYLDYDDSGQRVAQARATPERRAAAQVAIRVDGTPHSSTGTPGPGRGTRPGRFSVT